MAAAFYSNNIAVTIPEQLVPYVNYCPADSWDRCPPQYIGGIVSIALLQGSTELNRRYKNDVVFDQVRNADGNTILNWVVWPIANDSGQLILTASNTPAGTWFTAEFSGNVPDHYWRELLSLWDTKRTRYYLLLKDNMNQYLMFDEPSFRVDHTHDTGATRSASVVAALKIKGIVKRPYKYLDTVAINATTFSVGHGCSDYLATQSTLTAAQLNSCTLVSTDF